MPPRICPVSCCRSCHTRPPDEKPAGAAGSAAGRTAVFYAVGSPVVIRKRASAGHLRPPPRLFQWAAGQGACPYGQIGAAGYGKVVFQRNSHFRRNISGAFARTVVYGGIARGREGRSAGIPWDRNTVRPNSWRVRFPLAFSRTLPRAKCVNGWTQDGRTARSEALEWMARQMHEENGANPNLGKMEKGGKRRNLHGSPTHCDGICAERTREDV
jgi:hypothetical protein